MLVLLLGQDSVHFKFETVLTAVRLLWRVSLFSPKPQTTGMRLIS